MSKVLSKHPGQWQFPKFPIVGLATSRSVFYIAQTSRCFGCKPAHRYPSQILHESDCFIPGAAPCPRPRTHPLRTHVTANLGNHPRGSFQQKK
eukprot:8289103-Karenia_brevis.AAC.1